MSIACRDIRDSLSNFLFENLDPSKNDPFYLQFGKGIAMIMIAPIGLIEGVVRGLFALLATLIAVVLPPIELRNWYQQHIFSPLALGSVLSLGTGLTSISYGLTVLFQSMTLALAHLISPDEKTARMPPTIWCCCTNKEEIYK